MKITFDKESRELVSVFALVFVRMCVRFVVHGGRSFSRASRCVGLPQRPPTIPVSLLLSSVRHNLTRFIAAVWGRCKDIFGQAWGLCETQTGPPPSHEDMQKDMEIGAKHGWKYAWAVEDMPTVYCYGAVRGRGCPSQRARLVRVVSLLLPPLF